MTEIKNLDQLIKAKDKNATVSFGKHRGKKLKDVPAEYLGWARKAVTLDKKIPRAKKIYEIYEDSVEEATGVPIGISYTKLGKDEKKIWEIFSRKLKGAKR